MPPLRAPRYGQADQGGPRVSPTVEPAVRQDPRAPLEAFGGGAEVAQAGENAVRLGQAGGQLGQAMAQAAQEADRTMVLADNLKAQKVKEDFTNEMSSYKGPEAVKMKPALELKFKKELEKISGGQTGSQRRMSTPMMGSHMADFSRESSTHVLRETDKFTTEAENSTITNESNNAAREAFDERLVLGHRQNALAVLDLSLARRLGVRKDGSESEKQIFEDAKLEVTSPLWMGVINSQLTAGAHRRAKQTFEKYKNEIDPKYWDNIGGEKGSIRVGEIRARSQAIVDKLVAKYDDPAAAKEEMVALTKHDPELREAVESRSEREFALKIRGKGVVKEERFLRYLDPVKQKGTLDVIPPQELQLMSKPQREALVDAAAKSCGIEVKPKPEMFAKYNAMPPGELARVTPAEMGELSVYTTPQQFQRISDQWTKARDTTPISQAEAKSIYTDKQMAFKVFKDAGIAGVKKDAKSASMLRGTVSETYQQFEETFNEAVMMFTKQNGKPPTDEQKKGMLDNMALHRIEEDGGFMFFDKKIHAFEEEPVGAFVSPIPIQTRREIVKARMDKNLPMTEADIQNHYQQMVSRGR